jgi:hypothetical protein
VRPAPGPGLPRRGGQDRARGHARFSPRGQAAAGLNRALALAGLNARLLGEFSRQTTERLRAALPLRIALPARALLAEAREIDREFLGRVARLPVRIEIPYERIEPLRLKRIELGLDFAYRILQAWARGSKAVAVFPGQEGARRLLELLELYALETEALSHTVRLPPLLAPLRERLGQGLIRVMRDAAAAAIASHKAR